MDEEDRWEREFTAAVLQAEQGGLDDHFDETNDEEAAAVSQAFADVVSAVGQPAVKTRDCFENARNRRMRPYEHASDDDGDDVDDSEDEEASN
jgi:hypothetical protein